MIKINLTNGYYGISVCIICIILLLSLGMINPGNAQAGGLTPDTLSGMVMRFAFDEGVGSTTQNLPGGNIGRLTGNASWIDGHIRSAIQFDSNSYVSVESSPTDQGFASSTICAWVYPTSFSGNGPFRMIAVKSATEPGLPFASPYEIWGLWLDENGKVIYSISDGNPSDSSIRVTSGQSVKLNSWYNVCGVYDGNLLSVFVNGYQDPNTVPTHIVLGTNSIHTLIGAYGASDEFDGFLGGIDDVRLYNRALSSTDIATLFNRTAPQIHLNGDSHVSLLIHTPYVDQGAVAVDVNDGGSLLVATSTNPISGIDINTVGTYTETYTATEPTGLFSNVDRTIDIRSGGTSNGDDDGGSTGTTTASSTNPGGNGGTSNGDDDGNTGSDSGSHGGSHGGTSNGGDDGNSGGTNPSNGSGNGTSSGTNAGNTGAVINAPVITPVTAPALVPDAPAVTPSSIPAPDCSPYLSSSLKYGNTNDPEEVKKLQAFYDESMGLNLPITGLFGQLTLKATKEFQVQHKDEIIQPWLDKGLIKSSRPSGTVGPTTLRAINNLICPTLDLPMPELN